MAGLNLIKSYLSDSEDSEGEDKADQTKTSIIEPEKKQMRFPIPASILSLEGAKHHETICDDPTLHDGRIRSFKHERGNWATLVYVDYTASDALVSWIKELSEDSSSSEEAMRSFSEFHLSLTRSLILKFHWIESFVDSLRILCQNTAKLSVELSDLKVYCNEDRTRTFVGIQCEDRSQSLKNFIERLDKLLAEYQLPPFYREASFHISILWCLGNNEEKLNARLPSFNKNLLRILTEDMTQSFIEIRNINCKIGNKIYTFNLK